MQRASTQEPDRGQFGGQFSRQIPASFFKGKRHGRPVLVDPQGRLRLEPMRAMAPAKAGAVFLRRRDYSRWVDSTSAIHTSLCRSPTVK
jgi:hypothetical protein